MSAITILLVAIVALLAGMEGILDEFQFHQPLVACTLIGLVTGHLQEGILLGGSLQMMALGWANVGAAVAPDAALASVASSIIMVLALNGGATDSAKAVTAAIAVAVPLSVAGLFLTMICRTIATAIAHAMDGCAEKGDFSGIERWQYAAIPQLTLIALGLIGISLALIYLGLKDLAKQGGGTGGGSGDPLGDILNDYE